MLKQIPNLITLCNLICGCIAISFIMTANPHLITTNGGEDYYPIWGSPKLIYGSYFIFLAALFDVFDGMAARALKVESPLGKDLDSLADVVSFGVAPAMIIYQLIWMSVMKEPKALDVPSFYQFFAFLLPCAGAYRLARFNQNNKAQAQFFQGMPIPAAGILVALLPFSLFSEPVLLQGLRDAVANGLEQKWVLMGITVLMSYLMVSTGPFLKWKAPKPGIAGWWAHILIVLAAILGILLLGAAGLLLAFLVYIIVSKLYRYPAVQA
jgi:CDP-diacylglycerol--serine O-phosphatidyltransferase